MSVDPCNHCEAGDPLSIITHRVLVESTEPYEDALHHSVAVRPLCRTTIPNETSTNYSRIHIINVKLISVCELFSVEFIVFFLSDLLCVV